MEFNVSVLFTKRFWLTAVAIVALVIFVALRSSTAQEILENLTPPELPDSITIANRDSFDQNWDAATTERFHFVSQGTATLPIPYDWLIALEQPESSAWGLLWPGAKPAFTEANYLGRYGFIASPTSDENPDGLPIGFAATPFQNLAGYPTTTTAIGFTCAACHTGRLVHGDTEYLVEGGPAVTDLQGFSKGLGASLGQTFFASKLPLPNKRFDRFARRLLGDTYSATTKAKLAKDMKSVIDAGAESVETIAVVEGFGRLDALNRIGNQVFSKNTGQRNNYTPIDAPVNYPQIWTASWFDWVQYDGSIMQPLIRNAGEALGVHAAINTTAPIDEGRFSSSIPVEDLNWIEATLAGPRPPAEARAFGGLLSPKWPASLGDIDSALAAEGADLYARHCKGCHMPPLNSEEIWSERYFKPIEWQTYNGAKVTQADYLALKIIDIDEIGTDAAQSDILALRTVNTAADEQTGRQGMGIDTTVCAPKPQYTGAASADSGYDASVSYRGNSSENSLVPVQVQDGPMLSFALALGAVVQQTDNAWFNANNVPADQRLAFEGDRPNCLQAGAGYKARPLNGVWATGPFLHNGSVPTLDDLLRPADERPRFVRLGDPTFDTVKVGLQQPELSKDSYPAYVDGYFILDTAVDGNRNTGHAFGASKDGTTAGVIGPEFTDRQRQALIEYLKTL